MTHFCNKMFSNTRVNLLEIHLRYTYIYSFKLFFLLFSAFTEWKNLLCTANISIVKLLAIIYITIITDPDSVSSLATWPRISILSSLGVSYLFPYLWYLLVNQRSFTQLSLDYYKTTCVNTDNSSSAGAREKHASTQRFLFKFLVTNGRKIYDFNLWGNWFSSLHYSHWSDCCPHIYCHIHDVSAVVRYTVEFRIEPLYLVHGGRYFHVSCVFWISQFSVISF